MVEDKEQKNIESFISENNFDDLEKMLGHIKQRYRLGIFIDFVALGFITLGVLSLHIDLYKNIVPTSSSIFLIILGIIIQIFLLIENSTIKRDYYKQYQAINKNLKKTCVILYTVKMLIKNGKKYMLQTM